MEIKWNKRPQEVIKDLQKDIDNFAYRVIEATGNDISKTTRRNINNAINEIPADNPIIRVYSMPTFNSYNGWSKTILCEGEQVLFVEFGAGQKHQSETSSVMRFGNEYIEVASRPKGIVQIGNYGQHHGKGDVWFYKSANRRESLHSHFAKVNRQGEFIMITSGIRPVRALWRAVGTSIRKLGDGRLKIK